MAALERDSRKFGTTGGDVDFALLVDGLEAERAQGITIDVAYRYFSTDKRVMIVADTPGHEQFTRNMATGASGCDAAVILIDARKGVLTQTRRHSAIVSLLGIREVILAINKIDLVGFSKDVFDAILADYAAVAEWCGFSRVVAIPCSARFGDNLRERSTSTPWYDGPTLLEALETIAPEPEDDARPFRLPVQWVNRPNLDFRGFSGTVAAGRASPGDPVVVAASGQEAVIRRILGPDGDLDAASAGQAVTVVLDREIDVTRGDLLAARDDRPEVSDGFAADLVWMDGESLLPGRGYLLRLGAGEQRATITSIKGRLDPETFQLSAAKTLGLNDIGEVKISTAAPVAFDPYRQSRGTGCFILIDRLTNRTVAAGMIRHGLRRATNVHLQAHAVDKAARARLLGQRPRLLWFTGLSGSGKSTIADAVETSLHAEGRLTYLLDGDNLRHGLNKDLGFAPADRVENIRRVGEVSRLFLDAGAVVIVCLISPFAQDRRLVRELVEPEEFVEIFVDTPLETCIARDPKGLYKKALAGEIPNFTGIGQAYERPERPELRLDGTLDAAANARAVLEHLRRTGALSPP